MSRIFFLLIHAITLLLWLSLTASAHSLNMQTPKTDDRTYHSMVLSNQLTVLLISDPTTDKAAVSLNVNVGSHDNPENRPGLAHFLEHMLFLGTKKYPDAAEYHRFISNHGGSSNAYTAATQTNYYFDIDKQQLDPGLDRFAQFFISPLLNAQYVERERHAVHSEYQLKIKNDFRRELDIDRQQVHPQHPFSRFAVGNLDTLADDNLREDLLVFYKTHYSSTNMALVVLGKESIAELKTMVIPRFSQIPQRKTPAPPPIIPLFSATQLPVEVVSRPVKDTRKMNLSFPLPSMKPYYRQKPLHYLSSLLGHEGKGSLLSVLKQAGWAETLFAGGNTIGTHDTLFTISIGLTKQGIEHRDKVRALVFHVLDIIRKSGVEHWRYREEQQLSEIAFQFREKQSATATVVSLSSRLHDYPVEELMDAGVVYKQYDPQLIQTLLSKMTPDNLYVHTTFPEAVTDKITHYYHAPYAVKKLPPVVQHPSMATQFAQYRLPVKNSFIPTWSAAKSPLHLTDNTLNTPVQLPKSNLKTQLWVKQDLSFGVPKATISLQVQLPLAAASLRNASLNKLLIAMINDQLIEFSYPANLAGLSYSLTTNSRGFNLYLRGYDNKMSLLLSHIMAETQQPTLDKENFTRNKTRLMRALRNHQKSRPVDQISQHAYVSLLSPYWSASDMVEQLTTVTFKELQTFATQWLQGARLKGLFYGNINTPLIQEWEKIVIDIVSIDAKTANPVMEPLKVVKLPTMASTSIKESTLTVDHNDNAIILYVQGPSDSLEDRAKMLLLHQLFKADFYSQLRTEQQLGYLIGLYDMTIKDVPGIAFAVQSSNTSVSGIKKAIKQFIQQVTIPDDLSAYQQSVATHWLEKPQNLDMQAERYWDNILKSDDSFSYRQRLVDAVNRITVKELTEYVKRTLKSTTLSLWFSASKKNQQHHLVFPKDQPVYEYP